MKYTWAAYYQKVYEAEKKKNTVLAGKVADAEKKREELQEKYAAICRNPLYRMTLPFLWIKRGIRRVASKTERCLRSGIKIGSSRGESFGRKEEGVGRISTESYLASYEKRLAHQRDSYGQWIKEEEPVLWRKSLEMLHSKAEIGRRKSCLVVSYQELSGIKQLFQMMKNERKPSSFDLRDKIGEGEEKNVSLKPDILLFAEHPEDLDERAVFYIEDWFTVYPETKLFYGAEDHKGRNSKGKECRAFPWFKPCWSPDTLLGFFYFGSYFAVDMAWAEQISLSGYGDARQNLYDFVLRLLKPYYEQEKSVVCGKADGEEREEGKEREERCGIEDDRVISSEIVHTDLILYHQSIAFVPEIVPDLEYYLHTGEMRSEVHMEFWGYEKEYIKLKQDFINNLCYEMNLEKNEGFSNISAFAYQSLYPEVWSVVPKVSVERKRQDKAQDEIQDEIQDETKSEILISVVIPSKDHPELLRKCIGSFLERTCLSGLHGAMEFIVVDNGSKEQNRQMIQDFLDSVTMECHYLYQPMEFNFSAMCNEGVRKAKGKYILLLNDDMEIIEENWLRIMVGQTLLPGVGAVGAKLWYPKEERLQHAGITNMHIGPSHKLVIFPDDRTYYYGHNTVVYDMVGVTAACLLVKKSIYEEVGGLDEGLAVSYNDVDFCFKLIEAGYRNVLRNDAVLLHHESASRGADEASAEKWLRLLQEKTKLYKKHPLFYKCDPYYSDRLADNASDYRIGYQYPYERRLLTAEAVRRDGTESLRQSLSHAVMLTVERAGNQHKIHLDEPDILEIEGWCYMLWQDNCLFERWLILEAQQGDFYYQIPIQERLRPDVEAILPQQKNIALSGFVGRILKEDVISDNYVVGMLYRNALSGKFFYQRSEKELHVTL